jgi:DNA-binding cell septation regulator SpoVG
MRADFPDHSIPDHPTRRHHVQVLAMNTATSGNLRALADVQIGASLIIHGVKIIQQVDQAAWVAMPSREYLGSDGTRKFSPILKVTGQLKLDIEEAVLSTRNRATRDV